MVHLRSSSGQTAGRDAEHVATGATRPLTTKRQREPDHDPGNGRDDRPAKALKLRASPSKPLSKPPRKRDVAHESSSVSHEGLHPPAKISAAQPHRGLLQTINGVQSTLSIRDGGIATPQSQVSTPAAEEAVTQTQKRADKRTLRSQDGGSRLKSELFIYFPNYDDIINDAPTEDGMWNDAVPQWTG